MSYSAPIVDRWELDGIEYESNRFEGVRGTVVRLTMPNAPIDARNYDWYSIKNDNCYKDIDNTGYCKCLDEIDYSDSFLVEFGLEKFDDNPGPSPA